jgi:intracellular sulfur oxidation DsrE/DsrF family protein
MLHQPLPFALRRRSCRQETTMNPKQMIMAAVLAATSLGALAQDKVVYHVNDTQSQALSTLRNIRNHLDTDPTAQITLVTHAFGVDFLMEGMKDRNESPFAATVAALVNRGVKFEVCEITLKNRSLKREQFIQEANFTPSGVVRLTKLQLLGFAYIKP